MSILHKLTWGFQEHQQSGRLQTITGLSIACVNKDTRSHPAFLLSALFLQYQHAPGTAISMKSASHKRRSRLPLLFILDTQSQPGSQPLPRRSSCRGASLLGGSLSLLLQGSCAGSSGSGHGSCGHVRLNLGLQLPAHRLQHHRPRVRTLCAAQQSTACTAWPSHSMSRTERGHWEGSARRQHGLG